MAQSKAPNYSDEAVARMEAVYNEASTDEQRKNAVQVLATELGKTTNSIVSKLVNMGIYVKAQTATKPASKRPETKAQIVADISETVALSETAVKGLIKADRLALVELREALSVAE